MAYKYMLYEEKDEIGILTLNRPEKRNTLALCNEVAILLGFSKC